jgi:hypothetical protein
MVHQLEQAKAAAEAKVVRLVEDFAQAKESFKREQAQSKTIATYKEKIQQLLDEVG